MTMWQEAYAAAVLETHPKRLNEKLHSAEGAIFLRLQELAGDSDHSGERTQIADAIRRIRSLQVTKLNFPRIPNEI